jgi:hypothetical protein
MTFCLERIETVDVSDDTEEASIELDFFPIPYTFFGKQKPCDKPQVETTRRNINGMRKQLFIIASAEG